MLDIKKRCCGQCLFTENKIVSDERKMEIINKCVKSDTHFICHKTDDVVCKGFYSKFTSQSIRIAHRLGGVNMVD